MKTFLTMLFPQLETTTSLRVLAVAVLAIVAVAALAAAARRWRSDWWMPLALLAAGFAMTALASSIALRMFAAAVDDMGKKGGGIAAISFGIWQATQVPLAAAWMALITSAVAGVWLLRLGRARGDDGASVRRPAAFSALIAAAMAAGTAPALLFRQSISFVIDAVTRGKGGSVIRHLAASGAASATCVVVAVALMIVIALLGRRSSASAALSVVTTIALVVSLNAALLLVFGLHSTSEQFRAAALKGEMSVWRR
jgi:hypothetical protein